MIEQGFVGLSPAIAANNAGHIFTGLLAATLKAGAFDSGGVSQL